MYTLGTNCCNPVFMVCGNPSIKQTQNTYICGSMDQKFVELTTSKTKTKNIFILNSVFKSYITKFRNLLSHILQRIYS
jgi:hypothetical protein